MIFAVGKHIKTQVASKFQFARARLKRVEIANKQRVIFNFCIGIREYQDL